MHIFFNDSKKVLSGMSLCGAIHVHPAVNEVSQRYPYQRALKSMLIEFVNQASLVVTAGDVRLISDAPLDVLN